VYRVSRVRGDWQQPVGRRGEATDDIDVEALNDRFALQHSIDEYYARAPLPIRLISRSRLAIIRHMVGESAGLDVCEIGAGGGHVLRMFPHARLTAIDVSGVFLDMARRNLAGHDARFVKGEVDKLDLAPESYDRIICTEVLEHTVDPDAILAAMVRLVRPAGVVVITVPNDPLVRRLKGLVRRSPIARFLDRGLDWGGEDFHLHRWTPAEFQRLLARHLQITRHVSAPFRGLPIHACFRCVRR
jgi:2-polyprenyl-3-methyl-5-hydroxy-6-metoxy-1,4-benzoquinol methylase